MNDIYRPKHTDSDVPSQHRSISDTAKPQKAATKTFKINISLAPVMKFWRWLESEESQARVVSGTFALMMIFAIAIQVQTPLIRGNRYDIAKYQESLLKKSVELYGEKLELNQQSQMYEYNKDYNPTSEGVAGAVYTPKFTASFEVTDKKVVTVTDPVNKVNIALTPKFRLDDAQKDTNHVIYPLQDIDASMVYTTRMGSVKEDIILDKFQKDELALDYEIKTSDGSEIRIEKDGSLAVYGVSSSLLGNITTGSDKDAELLLKARQNGKKTQLLFTIPAPFIAQADKKKSPAKTWFTLDGNKLTIHASGLKAASYPLSIDPSVYIETASKLMRGNNESNVNFDVANELIQKGQTTGARIDAWTSTNNLSTPIWGQGTAVAGGYIYSAGGSGGNSTTTATYYTAGASTFPVPTGVTSITVKAWGAGGGGGAGSNSTRLGGNGGGGGYAKAVLTTTPGETLDVLVGSAGSKGAANTNGGDGGGYSAVKRSATFLVQAGGGGGGGGTRGTANGGAAGAGGGASGVTGSAGAGTSPQGGGGGAGTNAAGGGAGTAGTGGVAGTAGAANAGGNAPSIITSCATAQAGTGGAGGTGGGGNAGTYTAGNCSSGGGGGGGRFGGGGGGSTSSNNRGGGGGGGGSDLVTGTGTVETAGSGVTQGNSADVNNNGSGLGGTGAITAAAATAGADGGVVITYTVSGSSVVNTVAWAKFNTTTNAIESPNPGAGVCTGWCNNSVYNLPTALTDLSLVAYNGFLYAIGGANSGGTPQTSVYIAKIGANGEPQLWHPSGGTPVYWYTDTALGAARSKLAAAAYNNKLYILGGLTTSSTLLSSNTVQYASINPTGTLGTWTATGMSALTSVRYGLSAQIYNDTMYVIGGDATFTGAPISTVEYAKLNSDGTMNSWVSTNSLITSGRMTMGGSYSTIWGGYIYVAGGCTAVNGSGYCTTMASDVQLASINADGSVAEWNTIIGLTNSRVGHTLIAWQGGLYRLGGCRTQNTSSGVCDDTVFDVDYGVVNHDGDASTVDTSVPSGTAPCTGAAPDRCDTPSANIGNVLSSTAIMNGYLYIMGGCTNDACTTVSSGVLYTSIASDGHLGKPATCTGTFVDSYCSSTSTLPNALGAAGTTVFNGRIYIVGGFPTITNVSYVSVNADGSLGAWASSDLTTIGATDVSYAITFARANPSLAGTFPGNLYILGGCSGTTSGIGCSGYSQAVYKCSINTTGVPSACSTTGQLQIGTATDGAGTSATGTGLGAMVGTVYANYIYLAGGLAPGLTDLKVTRYAKIDNSNNIVAVSGGAWIESTNLTVDGRRRGSGFGYNGYLYVVGGYDGTGGGVLADIEFAKIDVSNGSIGAWNVSSVTINQRWGLSVPVSNSYAYVIGGCTVGAAPSSCTSRTNSIQTFQIYNNDSGAPVSYISRNNTGVDRIGGSATIMNGYIYYAGGCTDIGCTTFTKTTYYAPIDIYGVIGTWAAGGTMPGAGGVAWGKLLNAGGTLYYIGGQTGNANTTAQATVYYSTAISTGNPTWGTAANGLGAARTQIGAAVWNNRMYVVGGYSTAGTVQSTVYSSPQMSTGGDIGSAWSSSSTAFNVARAGATAVAYANNLYVFGGIDTGGIYLSDSQYSQISTSTGLAGSWTYTTSLPVLTRDADGFAANGYMYIVGGRSAATSCAPRTLAAPISANTTIATGNNPTGVGEWFQTNVNYTGDRYGAAAVYGQGRAYVLGGGCSAIITTTDRTYSTTLKSQPQMAKYSRMIDTDTDVFPTKWLLNGLDNSTGAQWYLKYLSMTNTTTSCTSPAMTTWGQVTDVGAVTLGTPGTYTPKNGAGTNTNCARFFYLSVNIDSSQAFGYPEDVTRGPTITDLSLFFTADPSKRLIHGKTFVDGTQQPLDTPF